MFLPNSLFYTFAIYTLTSFNKCSESIESVEPCTIYSFKKGLNLKILEFLKSCLVAVICDDSNLSQMYL